MTDIRDTVRSNGVPQPVRGREGATILGPRNVEVELQNPDLLTPPTTDSGTIPNQWMALTPPALVRVHLKMSQDAIDALSTTKPVIMAGAPRAQARRLRD